MKKRIISLFLTFVIVFSCFPTAFSAKSVDNGYVKILSLLKKYGEPYVYEDHDNLFTAISDSRFKAADKSTFALFDMESNLIFVGGKMDSTNTRVAVYNYLDYADVYAAGKTILSKYREIAYECETGFAYLAYDAQNELTAVRNIDAMVASQEYSETFKIKAAAKATATPKPTSTPKPTAKPTAKPTSTPKPNIASSGQSYIGNKNTKKFHYPWCSSVDQMKEKNKVVLHSRTEAINGGYKPCKKCNP